MIDAGVERIAILGPYRTGRVVVHRAGRRWLRIHLKIRQAHWIELALRDGRPADVGKIAGILLLEGRGHGGGTGQAAHLPKTFVIAEKEGLVLDNRPSQAGAELVLVLFLCCW